MLKYSMVWPYLDLNHRYIFVREECTIALLFLYSIEISMWGYEFSLPTLQVYKPWMWFDQEIYHPTGNGSNISIVFIFRFQYKPYIWFDPESYNLPTYVSSTSICCSLDCLCRSETHRRCFLPKHRLCIHCFGSSVPRFICDVI